jgi:hypothetical protein
MLPVVLCGCETWSFTLREECRLRVFETRFLGRIFGPKRDESTVEWRRLHNKELCAVYSSPNIILVIKSGRQIGRACRTYVEKSGAYRVLVGKPEGRNHLEDPDIAGMIILKWVLEKWDGASTESIWLRIGIGGGLLSMR